LSNAPPTTALCTLSLHDALPISRNRDGRPVRARQWAEEGARRRVEGVDVPGIFYVSDQDVVAECAEVGRGLHDTPGALQRAGARSEEHTSELQSLTNLVCRLLLE